VGEPKEWNEWSQYVLLSLERNDLTHAEIIRKNDECHASIKRKLDGIHTDMVVLKVKASMFGFLSGSIGTALVILIKMWGGN